MRACALASREERTRGGVREVTVRVLGVPVWRSRTEREADADGERDGQDGRPVGFVTMSTPPLWAGDGGDGGGMRKTMKR